MGKTKNKQKTFSLIYHCGLRISSNPNQKGQIISDFDQPKPNHTWNRFLIEIVKQTYSLEVVI